MCWSKHASFRKCFGIGLLAILASFQITVGVFGHEEEVLDKPVSPNELKAILYRQCLPYDIRQAVLQQELILAIGGLIAIHSELFDGILKIRIGYTFFHF